MCIWNIQRDENYRDEKQVCFTFHCLKMIPQATASKPIANSEWTQSKSQVDANFQKSDPE